MNARHHKNLGGGQSCCTCGDADTPLAAISHIAIFGYKHQHVSIKSVDATSRFPLYVISRIIIDYLTLKKQEADEKQAKREAAKKHHSFF